MLGCYAADKDGNRAAEPELISHYVKDQLEAAGWCYVVAIRVTLRAQLFWRPCRASVSSDKTIGR